MRYVRGPLALCFVLLFSIVLHAQNTGTISGRVASPEGTPISDATVTLIEARQEKRVDSSGNFTFTNLGPGLYHVAAASRRAGSAVGEVDLAAGASQTLEIVIDPAIHSEEIVVTASPDTRGESEVYQPVNVMNEEELAARLQPTLGETLNQEPGVNSTYFGPGASRPVIRGLGADRIRVLEEGVGTGDASNISPDHAVSVDPANASQIEIVRGPATLLYGSNAVGGVVNVIDERIPRTVPAQQIGGKVQLRLGTVAEEKNGSVSLNGGQGSFAWHADASIRDTSDYEIPGPAEEPHSGGVPEEEEHPGILENSSLESKSATLGASWVGSRGFVGLSATNFQTNYGIPGHAHHEEKLAALQEEEEHVRIDMEQQRFDFKGETQLGGLFRSLRFRLGLNDYEHVELEGEEVGTRFTSESWEGRVEANHRQIGPFRGALGLQLSNSDFAAIGEEAFIPPNETEAQALFLFEEIIRNRWDFQFGARYENQDITSTDGSLPDRSFDGFSGSVGTIYRPSSTYTLALSVSRATRLPTAQELYADGPHLATGQFELGNLELEKEISLGIDLSLRKVAGWFRGELNFFNNSFDGFIFERPTGQEEDGLPVFLFTQQDARFSGFELETHTELWHSGSQHIELEAGADYVRGELNGGGNLPRIPPMRLTAGLLFEGEKISGLLEVWRYQEQDEIAEFETGTPGYILVNANVGYRFFVANTVHDFLLRGTNLTDKLARNHVSPLKDRVPLPGRDITLSYRLIF